MKRNLLIALALCAFAVVGYTQSMSTANEVAPFPTVDTPVISFPVMATPTITLGVTATAMPPVPAGSKGVWVSPTTNVAINYGGSNVVSGAGWPSIPGSQAVMIPLSAVRQPTIYFYATATGTTPTVRFTPFK